MGLWSWKEFAVCILGIRAHMHTITDESRARGYQRGAHAIALRSRLICYRHPIYPSSLIADDMRAVFHLFVGIQALRLRYCTRD